jgi:hypothetical protein
MSFHYKIARKQNKRWKELVHAPITRNMHVLQPCFALLVSLFSKLILCALRTGEPWQMLALVIIVGAADAATDKTTA